MTPEEYISKYVNVINNHITVEAIPEQGPFCATCWEQSKQLVKAPWNQQRNGWVCPAGHFGENGGLAKGQLMQGRLP